eukprot:2769811-Pyramimonas_sp.AAC.1
MEARETPLARPISRQPCSSPCGSVRLVRRGLRREPSQSAQKLGLGHVRELRPRLQSRLAAHGRAGRLPL